VIKTSAMLPIAAFLLVSAAFSAPLDCSNYSNYGQLVALTSTGCTVNGGQLLLNNFTFTGSATGSGSAQTAAQVGVAVLNNDGLTFSPSMNVTSPVSGTSSVDDLLSYSVSVQTGSPINLVKLSSVLASIGSASASATETVTCVTPGPSGCVNSGSGFTVAQEPVVPPQTALSIVDDLNVNAFSLTVASITVQVVGTASITSASNEFAAPTSVPEPASILFIASGLLGLGLLRRRNHL
jgi:PEP-CTERM motif